MNAIQRPSSFVRDALSVCARKKQALHDMMERKPGGLARYLRATRDEYLAVGVMPSDPRGAIKLVERTRLLDEVIDLVQSADVALDKIAEEYVKLEAELEASLRSESRAPEP